MLNNICITYTHTYIVFRTFTVVLAVMFLADAVSGEAADEKRREVRGKFLGGVHKPLFPTDLHQQFVSHQNIREKKNSSLILSKSEILYLTEHKVWIFTAFLFESSFPW